MYRLRCFIALLALAFMASSLPAQDKSSKQSKAASAKDVDPLALDVLRVVAEPVEHAQTFRFKALISEEYLASNNQIVTFFHTVDVTVQRPDKIHLVFRGRGQRVDCFGANGSITMYAPDAKAYTTLPTESTIEATLNKLNTKGVDIPIGPFLRGDFYDMAAKMVNTGYVIGRSKIFDQDVHQLAFTAPDADFQVWVTGGDTSRFVRVETVNKKLDGSPRTIIQFLDWDLSPSLASDEFTFTKTSDSYQVEFLPVTGDK